MIQSIHVLYEGDSYEVQLLSGVLNSIWLTPDNDARNPPQFISWESLPIDLQSHIEHSALRHCGAFDLPPACRTLTLHDL